MAGAGPWRVFAEPRVRPYLAAYGISRFGDKLYNTAQVVVVLRLTGSPAWVSAVLVAHSLPYVLVKPVAGVLVDRLDRRRVMVATDLGRLALMALLTTLVATNASPFALLAVVFATTTVGSPNLSALAATMPELVPEDALASANAAVGALTYICLVGGPLVAAVVLSTLPDAVPFALNGLTFLVSAVLVASSRPTGRAGHHERSDGGAGAHGGTGGAGAHDSVPRAMAVGVRLVFGDPVVRAALVVVLGSTFVVGLGEVMLSLVARDLLGIGDQGMGWLVAASGAGGVLGAGIAAYAARHDRVLAVMAVAGIVAAAPTMLLAAASRPWQACAVLLVGGLGSVTIDVAVLTALQRAVARSALGRVDALVSGLSYASLMLGNLAAPALIAWCGLQRALIVGAGAATLTALAVLVTRGGRTLAVVAPDVLAALRRIPSLRGLDEPSLEALSAAAGPSESCSAGTVLLVEGDPATEVLLLVSGDCDVRVGARGVVNRVVGPDLLGEIGVLHKRSRTASVVATSDCTIRRVAAADFAAVMLRGVELPGALGGVMAARLSRWPG